MKNATDGFKGIYTKFHVFKTGFGKSRIYFEKINNLA